MGCYLEDNQTGVYQLRPAVTVQVDLLVIQDVPKFRFEKHFADKMNEGVV